ncbi:MAG: isochorismate synthase [Propionibacteriaceae bacterium]
MHRLDVRAWPLPQLPDFGDLLRRGSDPMALISPDIEGEAVIGWGEAARFEGGWEVLEQWLAEQLPTSAAGALRALVTLTFDPERTQHTSVCIVPADAVVVSDGQAWRVLVGESLPDQLPPLPEQRFAAPSVVAVDRGHEADAYRSRVEQGLALIQDGELHKIVLATYADYTLTGAVAADLAAQLYRDFPSCWIYCIDGMVGASPELLMRLRHGSFSARVLAGTQTRAQATTDAYNLDMLESSEKNQREHAAAIASARAAMEPLAAHLEVSQQPYALVLPHVMHLASDLHVQLRPDCGVAEALTALHPTAAVGGTPTALAREQLHQIEGFDRGRFAGPIGWLSADGDAELVIALRGGQMTGEQLRLYAGAGIVAGSDPYAEWDEVNAKLRPMRQVLGLGAQTA